MIIVVILLLPSVPTRLLHAMGCSPDDYLQCTGGKKKVKRAQNKKFNYIHNIHLCLLLYTHRLKQLRENR